MERRGNYRSDGWRRRPSDSHRIARIRELACWFRETNSLVRLVSISPSRAGKSCECRLSWRCPAVWSVWIRQDMRVRSSCVTPCRSPECERSVAHAQPQSRLLTETARRGSLHRRIRPKQNSRHFVFRTSSTAFAHLTGNDRLYADVTWKLMARLERHGGSGWGQRQDKNRLSVSGSPCLKLLFGPIFGLGSTAS